METGEKVLSSDVPLPPLRQDLRIHRGAARIDGGPAWILQDLARHRYYQINERVVELLSFWGEGSVARLGRRLAAERGAPPQPNEIESLIGFLHSNSLTEDPPGGRSAVFARSQRPGFLGRLGQVLRQILFLRIPLARPDGFLRATLPVAELFFSRTFTVVVVLLGVIGMVLASRQSDAFLGYVQNAFTPQGIVAYALTLAVVKVLHELGHAYQATRRGVRVTTMGIAFMVFFPMLYTDVTDAWRLRRRRDRLMIDAGGVLVELHVALLATFAWSFLPDGPARYMAFVLALSSWAVSLFVNLNPLMRFDGYYLLADGIGVHNLQPRSFVLARWRLRELLFDLGQAPPEAIARPLRRFMIVYAVAIWIYRLILFTGISLMVYVLFFKALGVFLLVSTLTTLIGLPVLSEIKEWWRMRKTILSRRRSAISALVVMALVAGLAIPLPRSVRAPGVLELTTQFEIYPPMSGQLEAVYVSEGEGVAEGDVLMEFVSPELDAELEMAVERIALLRARLDRSASDTAERAMSRVLAQQLKAEEERVAGLKRSRAQLQIVAPFDGAIAQLPPAVTAGLWVSRETQLGLVVQPGAMRVRGYFSEDNAALVAPGEKGVFVADDPAVRKVEIDLQMVLNIAAERIDPPSLSAAQGGTIPVEVGGDADRPAGAWYAFESGAQATDPHDTALRGIAVFGGDRVSLLNRALRQVAKVLVREFGV